MWPKVREGRALLSKPTPSRRRDVAAREPSKATQGEADDRPITCAIYHGNRVPQNIDDLTKISDVLHEVDSFVWFDVVAPSSDALDVLQHEFGLHPLAIEDAVHAHQRPKIDAYDGYWFIVMHGVTQSSRKITVHEIAVFAGAKFIVTVRASPAYPLDEILRRWNNESEATRSDSGALLYEIFDTVVDGYAQVAESYELKVEEIGTDLFSSPSQTNDVLLSILAMKNDVQRFRRAVVPMHEILTPLLRGDTSFFEAAELPYYRDVYDHTVRVIDQLDAARDLITNALDVHISIASNRQNEVAKQLTIIATIFLPLTYITGFFGQNFGVLVNHIISPAAFWFLGVGSEVAALVGLLAYFRYKRWF